MEYKITKTAQTIAVSSSYNSDWVTSAKRLGGRWDASKLSGNCESGGSIKNWKTLLSAGAIVKIHSISPQLAIKIARECVEKKLKIIECSENVAELSSNSVETFNGALLS